MIEEQAREQGSGRAALRRRAEAAEAGSEAETRVLELQREFDASVRQARARLAEVERRAREREMVLQQQADASEERSRGLARQLEQVQQDAEAREAEIAAAAAAPARFPALMRAAEGARGALSGLQVTELRALDEAWAAAGEAIRAERDRRARQLPDGFLCPITPSRSVR